LARRLELLDYARSNEAVVVEDDYDSEYHYSGEPIRPLHILDPSRVVHLGSFSKTFSPGLRLGFMLLPDVLRERIVELKRKLWIRSPALEQLAMARFIASRSFDRHILRMKRHYAVKRARLLAALEAAFGKRIRISGENAGLHVFVEFLDREFGPEDIACWERAGVIVDWVESYAIKKGRYRNCLVLGYGNLRPEQIDAGVQRFARVIGRRRPDSSRRRRA
jgi:GntR family transcriptional regulator/MocR family aminotransferase